MSLRPRLRGIVFDCVLLFLLAATLILPLFQIEWMDRWDSIDGAFIGDARFIRDNPSKPEWHPDWYCGTRFDYVYPPALRFGTAMLSKWLGVSTARSYHLYTAFAYCIGIAGVYVFARLCGGSRWWAWIAAVAAATISPSWLFLEHFRRDYSHLEWLPVRLGVLVLYGEGPHSTAVAWLSWALTSAWFGLRRHHWGALGLASVFSALVVSNNFYGATALAISFPIVVWAVWLAERDWRVAARAVLIAALAWGLTAFWLTPSYLRITVRNMRLVSAVGNAWSPIVLLVAVVIFAAVTWRLAAGKPERAWPVLAGGLLTFHGLNTIGNYYFNFRVIGEPERLVPEFDQAFLIAACLVLSRLASSCLGKFAILGAYVFWVAIAHNFIWHAWSYYPKAPGYEHRVEYQLSKWLSENTPTTRTYITGSLRFWYQAWGDVPEIGGGSDQGTLNLNTAPAHYAIVRGQDPQPAILWLQALGAGTVVVHDKNSEEKFHDFEFPAKFEGVLKKLFDDGKGNRVYEVPRRYPDRARVVDGARIRGVRYTGDEPDLGMIAAYVDVIERGPDRPVSLGREGLGGMRARVRLEPGELLVIQEAYDPAWRAYAGGKAIPITADPIEFMLVDPGPGEHDIMLRFETPLENRVGRLVTIGALLALAGIAAIAFRRRGLP